MKTNRIPVVFVLVAVIAALVTTAFAAADSEGARRKLVGTWVCDVPGDPSFRALQTFHADGTFTETSSLLGLKEEGPAHGVWIRDDGEYRLTFQLFAFDPSTGESTGMFRVRASLELDKQDLLTATFASVDLIHPDGTIEELGGGPDAYTCTRVKVLPAE